MNAYNENVYSLCKKIDFWRKEAEYWKAEYEKLSKDYSSCLESSLKNSQQCAGNMLKLLLADSNGTVLEKAFSK